MKVLNAFSFNMVAAFPCSVLATELTRDQAKAAVAAKGVESYVGHSSTAAVFSEQLGTDVPCIRGNVSMKAGDIALVGQYSGPRLDEGATTLPEGAVIKWLLVEVAS